MKQGADTGGWAGDGYWLCKNRRRKWLRKEEEQEEMKLGVMSFKRIEKEAVSVTSVVKALLQERGRDGVCF